jgi:hypothetical protein
MIRALIASRKRQLACVRLQKMVDREKSSLRCEQYRRLAALKYTRGE